MPSTWCCPPARLHVDNEPAAPGWDVGRHGPGVGGTSMARLGYDRYGAQGGDWGSMVTTSIKPGPRARDGHPPQHGGTAGPSGDEGEPTEAEQSALAGMAHSEYDSGSAGAGHPAPASAIRSSTRRSAWILDKFLVMDRRWRQPVAALGADRILERHEYASAAASARESFRNPPRDPGVGTHGRLGLPEEILRASKRWASRQYSDIRHCRKPPAVQLPRRSSSPRCSSTRSGPSSARCADPGRETAGSSPGRVRRRCGGPEDQASAVASFSACTIPSCSSSSLRANFGLRRRMSGTVRRRNSSPKQIQYHVFHWPAAVGSLRDGGGVGESRFGASRQRSHANQPLDHLRGGNMQPQRISGRPPEPRRRR